MIVQPKAMTAMATAVILTFIMLIAANQTIAGDLNPDGPPGSTMKTLDEIPPSWHQKLPASERFELVLDDAAVLDKETGLVWAKNANILGGLTWLQAVDWCRGLSVADRKGWRLPTVEEFASLLDMSQEGSPKLPTDHPFTNVQSSYYWSSTTYEGDNTRAYFVHLPTGNVSNDPKTYESYAWPVRGEE